MPTTASAKTRRNASILRAIFTAVGLLLGGALASPAAAVQCGETIGPNVNVTLSGTLVCDDSTGGVTIVGPAKVTLDEFYIICSDSNYNGNVPTGLRIIGRKAQVQATAQGGSAIAFCRTGIEVAGEGGHTVKRLQASNTQGTSFFISSGFNLLQRNWAAVDNIGFYVTGQDNSLKANIADGGHRHSGFYIVGDNTQLKQNSSSHSRHSGFFLDQSAGHQLTANIATSNLQHGFFVDANDCTMQKNQAFSNGNGISVLGRRHKVTRNEVRWNALDGIWMGAGETEIINNIAFDNNQNASPYSFDLRDLSLASCGTNTWQNNTFGTSNVPCIR